MRRRCRYAPHCQYGCNPPYLFVCHKFVRTRGRVCTRGRECPYEHILPPDPPPELVTPAVYSGNQTECTICLEAFRTGDSTLQVRNCEHIFHRDCWESWIGRGPLYIRCPNCRAPGRDTVDVLIADSERKIYLDYTHGWTWSENPDGTITWHEPWQRWVDSDGRLWIKGPNTDWMLATEQMNLG